MGVKVTLIELAAKRPHANKMTIAEFAIADDSRIHPEFIGQRGHRFNP
jgi:hypothetical protein